MQREKINKTDKYNIEYPSRKSIRLKDYDYSQVGAYFITICIYGKKCILGDVTNGEMWLNEYGKIIENEWLKAKKIRDNVDLDEYVVMPNHFHGIVVITHNVEATHRLAPTKAILQSGSVGSIICQFKSIVTKNIRKAGLDKFQWQRNYYEHIIRNEKSLNKIRQYIVNNPLKWELDIENPDRKKDYKDFTSYFKEQLKRRGDPVGRPIMI